MAVKFKIGFTIDAETLFSMISKFLPLEDLHVEEVLERPAPPPPQFVGKAKFVLAKPKRKHAPVKPVNLHAGINGIIIEAMSDGKPWRAIEFRPLLAKRNYSPNSVGSRLQSLKEYGALKQHGDGTWTLISPLAEKSA